MAKEIKHFLKKTTQILVVLLYLHEPKIEHIAANTVNGALSMMLPCRFDHISTHEKGANLQICQI